MQWQFCCRRRRTVDPVLTFCDAVGAQCVGTPGQARPPAKECDEECETEPGPTMQASLECGCQVTFWTLSMFSAVLVCLIVAMLIRPPLCEHVEECKRALNAEWEDKSSTPRSRAAALGVLLAKEVSMLIFARREFQQEHLAALGFHDQTCAMVVMCLVITCLLLLESATALGYVWVHAVPPTPGVLDDWGNVHTTRYLEWCINVPLLMVLCGHFILRRPLRELLVAIFVTDAYMYIAWVALVVSSTTLRIICIVGTFAGYLWASFDMLLWARRFLREAPPDLPRRSLRALLLVLLVLLFGFYGIIWLLPFGGLVSWATAEEIFARSDFFAKFTMSFVLANVNAAERQRELRELVTEYKGLSETYLSVLRGSFDHVMCCSLDGLSSLTIDSSSVADTIALEALLGRPVKGAALHDLLASHAECEQFKAYTQRVLEQHDGSGLSCDLESSTKGGPGMATLFRCNLAGQHDDNTCALNDECFPDRFPASIYLSWSGQGPPRGRAGRQMVIAMNVGPPRSVSKSKMSDCRHSVARHSRCKVSTVSTSVPEEQFSGTDEVESNLSPVSDV